MGEDEITLFALAETTKRYVDTKKKKKTESQKKEKEVKFEEITEYTDEDKPEVEANNSKDGDRKSSLKKRLSTVKHRLLRPDFARLLSNISRPDFSRFPTPNFSRFRGGLSNVNCFRVEDDDTLLENMEMERHKSIDLGLRRNSLYFFRRKQSVCQHPYHPYTPKQRTRLVWNCHHYKS